MRPSPLFGLAVVLALGGGAVAGERLGYPGYGYGVPPGGYGGFASDGYGFADGAVGGGYIGAPFTSFPRPSAIVPPVWGYGTYGVPTMTGIRQAPIGDPKVIVVRGVGPTLRRGDRRPVFEPESRAAPAGGPRVVSVTVPRR